MDAHPNFESSLGHTTSRSSDYAVALAAEEVNKALRAIRKVAVVQDLKFERLAITHTEPTGEIVDGLVLFAVKVSASIPPHRKTMWLPVYIRDGEVLACSHFRDSSDREYRLCEAAVKTYLGTDLAHFEQLKRVPNVNLSLTDRTVLPTLPARNFFSLAERKVAANVTFEMIRGPEDTTYGRDTRARRPGVYAVLVDGVQVGTIEPDEYTGHYRTPPSWKIYRSDGVVMGNPSSTLEEAKQKAIQKFGRRLAENEPSAGHPSFDEVNDQLEERWVDHIDPTISGREPLSGVGFAIQRTAETCDRCGGSGVCPACGGDGHECDACDGTGMCRFCDGSGDNARTYYYAKREAGGNNCIRCQPAGSGRCAQCGGSGRSPLPTRTCTSCGGSGRCRFCDGTGRASDTTTANALDGNMDLTVDGEAVDPDDLDGWATYEKTEPTDMVQMEAPFTVETLEGPMNGDAGDFLAMGPEGELYPVDGDIQGQTYREIERGEA